MNIGNRIRIYQGQSNTEQHFNKIAEGNISYLKKKVPIKIQETQRPQIDRIRKEISHDNIMKIPKVQNKEQIFKAAMLKDQVTCKDRPIQIIPDFFFSFFLFFLGGVCFCIF